MKKRFFTFLMAVWALLSISQTVKADDVTVYFQCPGDWSTPVHAYVYNNSNHFKDWDKTDECTKVHTSKGVELWKYSFDSKFTKVIFQDGNRKVQTTADGFDVTDDNLVYTSGGPDVTLSVFETKAPYTYTLRGGYGSGAWNNESSNFKYDGDGKYTYTFTATQTGEFRFRVNTSYTSGAALCPNVDGTTKQKELTSASDAVAYTNQKDGSGNSMSDNYWFCNVTNGKKYTFTLIEKYNSTNNSYTRQLSVVPEEAVLTTPIANRKYSEGYYLVGNFFNFDGDNINYKDAVFKFQQQKDDADGNAVYMVEIPATLTAKAQVMSVDATGTPVAVYGPTKDYATIGKTHPTVGVDHRAKLGPEYLVESTEISETCGNFWNMKSRRESKTGDGQDGSYTYYITIDKDSHKPSLWTIKYDDMKRVAYYLSTDEKATAMTLNSVRNDVNGDFNAGKYQGTLYAQEGSEFYAISNAMRQIENEDYIFAEYRGQVVNTENILSTYPKLFLWGNGGKPLGETGNSIAATNGTFKLSNGVVGISSWEFNSNNGNNDDNSKYGNTGGQVMQKSTNKTITSLSMVGPAIPGTTTGNEWDWTSTVADMDFDVSENCYKLTIATTEENKNQVFRFVGNHTKEINWFENGTEAADKAASYPYEDVSVGHKASPSDPNEVSYTQNGLSAEDKSNDDNLNIIWNRPAGTWTVRFYIYTYSQNGNDPSFRYFYTISENRDLELRDFKDVVYKSETNVRQILNRGDYQYFRTWSDNKAWKRPKNVDVFVVSKVTPADETHNVGFELKNINNFDTSEDVIPAKTGVILALKEGAEVPGAVFHKRKSLITYNTLVIPLEEATYKDLSYDGEGKTNLLVKMVDAGVVPTYNTEKKEYNYLFGFFRANKGLGVTSYEDNQFLLGFWLSKGSGLFYSNSAYLPVSEATAAKMNLGVSYDDFDHTPGVKKAPALLFDFANVGSGTTGINEVVNQSTKLNDGKYYTLSGQQVEKPTAGGIYIHNGRKFVVK